MVYMNGCALDFYKKNFLNLSLKDVISIWLDGLNPLTKKNYSSGINRLVHFGILDLNMIVEDFCEIDHNDVLDSIKTLGKKGNYSTLSESSIQARSACYISFTKFLNKWSKGRICYAVPSRTFGEETFFKIREKIKTNILTKSQWLLFFDELKKVSFREYLISKLIVQGIKSVGDVLNLKVSQLDFENNKISYFIRRRKNRFSSIQITYPLSLFIELKTYVGDRKDWIFVSDSGKKVSINTVYKSFSLAEKNLNLPFKITPRVLRASALSHLKRMGFSDYDIIRVSGHSSLEMIKAYNISVNENISSHLSLIV